MKQDLLYNIKTICETVLGQFFSEAAEASGSAGQNGNASLAQETGSTSHHAWQDNEGRC